MFCLITGVAGDIGSALANKFITSGYKIIGIDKVEKPIDLRVDHYIQLDLESIIESSYSSKLLKNNIEKYIGEEGLDVLINNAAIQVVNSFENITMQDWRTSLSINLLAPFLLSQMFVKKLEQQQGCIINISSIHATRSKPNFLVYSTCKAALSSMTRMMAVNLGKRVRVNAIEPAAINTKMLMDGIGGDLEIMDKIRLSHPVEKISDPEQLSNLALMIAEFRDIFFSGAVIQYDGGAGSTLI